MHPPQPEELERLAGALSTNEGLIEKDWHVVRALAALAPVEVEHKTRLIFGGGTSLSRGWGLIKRFSEDIDFRVSCERDEVPRPARRSMRAAVLQAMLGAGFVSASEPKVRDESRFVEMTFSYGAERVVPHGLRDHIKVELTMKQPRLVPICRPVQSFVCKLRGHSPEVSSIPCVDPVETAADKISAFAWRTMKRKRGKANDDPAIVRHLYDLAALKELVEGRQDFDSLARDVMKQDAGRGGAGQPTEPYELLSAVLGVLEGDAAWQREYDDFVHQVGYGPGEELISFETALAAFKGYIQRLA